MFWTYGWERQYSKRVVILLLKDAKKTLFGFEPISAESFGQIRPQTKRISLEINHACFYPSAYNTKIGHVAKKNLYSLNGRPLHALCEGRT